VVSKSPHIDDRHRKRAQSRFPSEGQVFFAIVDLYYHLRRIDFLPDSVEIYVSDFNLTIQAETHHLSP
jgi:hypothetical protein